MTSTRILKQHRENPWLQQREPLPGEAHTKTQNNKDRYATLLATQNSTQSIRMAQQTYNRLCSAHSSKLTFRSSPVNQAGWLLLKEVSKGQRGERKSSHRPSTTPTYFSTGENHSQFFSFLLAENRAKDVREATQLQKNDSG